MAPSRWASRIVLLALLFLSAGCGAGGLTASRAVSAMNVAAAEVLPPAQFEHALGALRAQGVRVVRSDAPWALIQPRPPLPGNPGWHWAQPDAWVSAFARQGLSWEPILDYSAGWAKTCRGFCAPLGNFTYAAFARAVAGRYGSRGTFWAEHPGLPIRPARVFEIWNEENVRSYHVAPGRYASLYAAARQAIRAVDPSARVIVGGLADDSGPFSARQDYPSLYVRAMFAARPGLAGRVDGFGLHPYGSSALDVEQWVVHFRQTLDGLGEGAAPIELTEFGWPTGAEQGETWRAQQMSFLGAALGRSNCGIGLVAPYDWANPAAPPSADFGLSALEARGISLRPAGRAWFRALERPGPELRLCPEAVPSQRP
jgi:hypothetical protein